jgi:undecaprenyl-diphosphatase
MSRKRAAKIAAVSRLFSRLGDGYCYALLGLSLVWLEQQSGSDFLRTGLIAFAIELPVYLLGKNLIRRQRPCDAIFDINAFLVPSDKFSFPSGHTAAAFVMAALCGFYYPDFGAFAYILATMIGSSRILLGVHYPTDILAGMVLGLSSFEIAVSLVGSH